MSRNFLFHFDDKVFHFGFFRCCTNQILEDLSPPILSSEIITIILNIALYFYKKTLNFVIKKLKKH